MTTLKLQSESSKWKKTSQLWECVSKNVWRVPYIEPWILRGWWTNGLPAVCFWSTSPSPPRSPWLSLSPLLLMSVHYQARPLPSDPKMVTDSDGDYLLDHCRDCIDSIPAKLRHIAFFASEQEILINGCHPDLKVSLLFCLIEWAAEWGRNNFRDPYWAWIRL